MFATEISLLTPKAIGPLIGPQALQSIHYASRVYKKRTCNDHLTTSDVRGSANVDQPTRSKQPQGKLESLREYLSHRNFKVSINSPPFQQTNSAWEILGVHS